MTKQSKKQTKNTWGGARKKSPDKYAVPTTVVRVPNPVLPAVKKIVSDYKAKAQKRKQSPSQP